MKKFIAKFFDTISMGTPQGVLIVFSSVLFIAAIVPTRFWDNSIWPCPIKKYIMPLIFGGQCPASGFFFGCRCPGCGMTHALSSLMHGNFQAAFDYNVLIIPVFLIIIYLIVSSLIKINHFK